MAADNRTAPVDGIDDLLGMGVGVPSGGVKGF